MSAPDYAHHPFLGLQIDTAASRKPGYLGYVLAHQPPTPSQIADYYSDSVEPLLPGEEPIVPGAPMMSVSMQKASSADGTPCQDLDEVEDRAIRDIMASGTVMPRPGDVFEIRRAMSAVAKQTRRGMGNVVLMHPATAYEFRHTTLTGAQRLAFSRGSTPHEESHGWRLFHREIGGSLPDIWIKTTVPEGVALVLYKGNGAFDCGFLAIGHWSQPVYLRNDYGQYKAEAYARIVKF